MTQLRDSNCPYKLQQLNLLTRFDEYTHHGISSSKLMGSTNILPRSLAWKEYSQLVHALSILVKFQGCGMDIHRENQPNPQISKGAVDHTNCPEWPPEGIYLMKHGFNTPKQVQKDLVKFQNCGINQYREAKLPCTCEFHTKYYPPSLPLLWGKCASLEVKSYMAQPFAVSYIMIRVILHDSVVDIHDITDQLYLGIHQNQNLV